MPMFRTPGAFIIQYMPGELPMQTAGTNDSIIWNVPADYYSDPERHSYPNEPSPWGYTDERRASLALYDFRRVDESMSATEQAD